MPKNNKISKNSVISVKNPNALSSARATAKEPSMPNARKNTKTKATKTMTTSLPNMKSRNFAWKMINSKKWPTLLSAAKTVNLTLFNALSAKAKATTLAPSTKRAKKAKGKMAKIL